MFKKIRNRILLLNMVMVSAVVITAFAVIFITTYIGVKNDNRDKLLYVYESTPQLTISSGVFVQGGMFRTDSPLGDDIGLNITQRISPDAGLSFSVIVDSENNVVDINSMVDLQEDSYALAASEALKNTAGGKSIVLEGRTWQYAVSTVSIAYTDNYNMAFLALDKLRSIRFLDITDSMRMIQSLALMLLCLTLVILIVFFFISRFFANRAIRPMEEAWDKQSRFVADASHELKTPLSIINANCGVLYANKDEPLDSQLKWVDSIMRAADRMTGLIGNLLSLTRIGDAQLELRMTTLDLGTLISEAVDEMEPAALEKGLKVNKQIEPNVEVENDKEHIRQVLSILLDNAVKYTDSAGEVTISLKKEKKYAVCSVRNTGKGIPLEEQSRLFDRFYRGDPSRSSENKGYGLGLAIAKAAVERLDAKLLVDSSIDEYTEFRFVIRMKM